MKTIFLVILFFAVAILPSMAAKSYEMEVLNLVQVNETEFTFDVRMRNTNPAEPFVIELIQWQLSFNNALMNGGSLNNNYLTYVEGTTDLVGTAIIPNSGYFSTNQVVVQWLTQSLGDGAQTTLFNTGDWKRIGTFKVQLRNTGSTVFHNFADVAHNLAFVPEQVIVNCCNYTTSSGLYYRNGAYFEIITNKTLTNSLSARNLASHCFTGAGNWSETARWNNVTSANANTLPGAANNAIIAGSATATDTRTVKDLTVAQGGYLLINTAAQITADNVYNDNVVASGGSGVVTLASWNFENATKRVTGSAYSADNGVASNTNISLFNLNGVSIRYAEMPSASGNYAGRIRNVLTDDYYYIYNISTLGYSNLSLSFRQILGNNGPLNIRVQTRPDNLASWVTLKDIVITTSGWLQESDLVLPVNLENKSGIQVRWLLLNDYEPGDAYIDDIIIKGEVPPSGMLIKSASDGTGSLIQSNPGVTATVERYIPATEWGIWNDGWHFLASPVAEQAIAPAFTTTPEDTYDFYSWYEQQNEWVNYKYVSGTTWATANTIANGLSNNYSNFLTGKGYMAAYQSADTKKFSGELNVSNVNISGLTINGNTANYRSWHLLGNPYSSALRWSDTWAETNIAGTAKIWNEFNRSYTDLSSAGATIPSGNGFMVQVSSGTGTLTIPSAARVHSTQAYYKSAEQSMMLTARNADHSSAQESIVTINPLATEGFDLEYDGEFLAGYAPTFFSVSGDEHFSTNCLPQLSVSMAIPFTFVKNEGSDFVIEATGVSNLAPEVWLLDKKTNTDQNLILNPVYAFTSAAGDSPDRFVLHFGTLSIVEQTPTTGFSVWYSKGDIRFSSVPSNTLSVSLTDMAGRELLRTGKPENDVISTGNNVASGWYLLRITLTDRVVVKKMFVN
jgi:hypothetical protein